MRTARSRIRRLLGLLVVAASVGRMLLRRRVEAPPALLGVPAPETPGVPARETPGVPAAGLSSAHADRPAALAEPTPTEPAPEVLATDAGLTAEPAQPAREPATAAAPGEPDVLATDAGLTAESTADGTAEPVAASASASAPASPGVTAVDAGLTGEPVASTSTPADGSVEPVAASASASAPASPGVTAVDAGLTGEPAAVAADGPAESEVLATDAGMTAAPADPAPAPAGASEDTMVLPRVVDPGAPAPTGTDNLRAIRGIGPAIERTLHELGITTYQQIAELHGEQLATVRGRLEAFSARIHREDWAGQARELHRQKYGV